MTPTLELTRATDVGQILDAGLMTQGATKAESINVAWLRTRIDLIQGDVKHFHERSRTTDLDARAHAKATSGAVADLLDELTASRGVSWSDLASAVGVSVGAVRKWRKGSAAAPENRTSLGRFAALLDVLDENAVADPAQWMAMQLPLPAGYFIRPMDVYVAGHADAVLEIAEHRQDTEQVLDQYMPGWRDRRSDFEIVTDVEGERIIRARSE